MTIPPCNSLRWPIRTVIHTSAGGQTLELDINEQGIVSFFYEKFVGQTTFEHIKSLEVLDCSRYTKITLSNGQCIHFIPRDIGGLSLFVANRFICHINAEDLEHYVSLFKETIEAIEEDRHARTWSQELRARTKGEAC